MPRTALPPNENTMLRLIRAHSLDRIDVGASGPGGFSAVAVAKAARSIGSGRSIEDALTDLEFALKRKL